MHWLACFFGGALFCNALPHLVEGVCARPFPTPFATPRGRGDSPAWLNVVWGVVNLAAGWLVAVRSGSVDPQAAGDMAVFAAGVLAMGLVAAWRFGQRLGSTLPAARPD